MALKQIGTTNTTTLRGLVWQPGGMSTADVASFMAALKDDTPVSNSKENLPPSTKQVITSCYEPGSGRLFIPGRGMLKLYPGDFMIYDPITGFPFVISGNAMANNPNWVTT